MEYMWLFVTAGGAVILGLALAYAMIRNRRLTASEKLKQDAKTRELYRGEEPAPPTAASFPPKAQAMLDEKSEAHANPPASRPPRPGTSEDRPRWEGPEETRPQGYLPAVDDPATDRDAAGENLDDIRRKQSKPSGS